MTTLNWGPTCHPVFSRRATKYELAPAASGIGNGLLAGIVGMCTAAAGKVGGSVCAAIFGGVTVPPP